MCFDNIKFNKESENYYNYNKEQFIKICGPEIKIPCKICGYNFHFDFICLRNKINNNQAQYFKIACFKIPSNLNQQHQYEELIHLDNNHI